MSVLKSVTHWQKEIRTRSVALATTIGWFKPNRKPFLPDTGCWSVRQNATLRYSLLLIAICIIGVAAKTTPGAYTQISVASTGMTQMPNQSPQQSAMQSMREAIQLLGRAGRSRPNADDPNRTGLIGVEWSDITSTLGDLEAKRTALTPLWAAVMVDELTAAGLQQGDILAVSLSGSFPGLNVAVLAAARALQLQVRVVASPTASMYGANKPNWAWTDMLRTLVAHGWGQNLSWAVTPGAGSDLGAGLLTDNPQVLKPIIARSGTVVLKGNSFEEMINARWRFYHMAGPVAAFVNVGGGHASSGDCPPPVAWNGLLKREWTCRGIPGLLWRFQKEHIPVFQLLNIKDLAVRYCIPIDPVPLPGWNDAASRAAEHSPTQQQQQAAPNIGRGSSVHKPESSKEGAQP